MTRNGPGRVLVAVYAVFALATSARAGVQLVTRFTESPVAYLLSAFASVVYVIATVALAYNTSRSTRIAVLACGVELAGVITVGTISVIRSEWFPDATVWSQFGAGYGYVPLVLPVIGLLFLRSGWSRKSSP
ncbi:MAG: hypothetical protein ACRCTR_09150 [Actinomycetota bacterium]